jgi:F-type H+-transporting ATPase subunit b
MLEFNKWFFVQLANFLILLVVLNYLLFRPMLNLFKERKDRINGFLDDAKAMDKKKEEALRQMEIELSEARNKAKAVIDALRKEGMETQKDIIEKAEKEAHEINKKAQKVLRAETEKARKALRRDVEAFSREIVRKLVGV